jgi:phosphoribosylanthranilate isomerase
MDLSDETGSAAELLERLGDRLRLVSEQLHGDETRSEAERLRERIRSASVAKVERNERFLARLRSDGSSNDAA